MKTALLGILPLLLAPAFAKTPGPAPRFDAWKIIGPGGGGTMIAPTISPHDPNLVVEHCDMTGAYITTDGALSSSGATVSRSTDRGSGSIARRQSGRSA